MEERKYIKQSGNKKEIRHCGSCTKVFHSFLKNNKPAFCTAVKCNAKKNFKACKFYDPQKGWDSGKSGTYRKGE